jgi:uncharacterized protein YndB with AHSA1/START domain
MFSLPVIVTDHDSVNAEIFIAAPPEQVFGALVKRDQALQWTNGASFETTLCETNAWLGGKCRVVSQRCGGGEAGAAFEHDGAILEFHPPHLLAYSWYANWHSDPRHETRVRWKLLAVNGGTRVRLAHTGLAALAGVREGYAQGWPGLLIAIKSFVESRQSNPASPELQLKSFSRRKLWLTRFVTLN